ncbi:MAG: amidase [Minwuiales bacterium]|nr:amidase [Minwuiales bacterium]
MTGHKKPGYISPTAIAEAEKLFGVTYRGSDRAMLTETVAGQIERVLARRQVTLPNALPPATVFSIDPPKQPRRKGRLRRSGGRAGPLPDNEEDIAFAPLTALSAWIRNRRLSSVRLTEIYLDRLKRFGPKLECVVTLTEELALKQAGRADAEIAAGRYRGPLHGIPWGAKDLLDTAGIATTWGAMPYRKRVPDQDAEVVRLLEEAGAVLVAKTTLGALASGDVWFGGQTRNPWNPDEGSSGSSAGSASATAAGLVGFSIGSETLGSIVSPCMRCGTTGLRPTFGRVPRTGAMALCWSLDKIGPICRSVEDTALVLAAINAFDAQDPGSRDVVFDFDAKAALEGLRVGYAPDWFEGEDATDADRAALAATKSAGLELVEIALPDLPYQSLYNILFAEAASSFEDLTLNGRVDQLVRQDSEAWPNMFRQARFLSAVDHIQTDRFRRLVMQMMAGLFDGLGAILGPSFAGSMNVITNFTGHPSLTLPAGFVERTVRKSQARSIGGAAPVETGKGEVRTVPHGVTLWGPLFEEGTLCRIGMGLEAALGVRDRRPPL